MSALFLTLLLITAQTDPPTTDPDSTNTQFMLAQIVLEDEAKPPAAGTLEAAIATALRNHPDVKVAAAKRMLADAEVEQTKLAVTKQISTATVGVQAAREQAEIRAQAYSITESAPGVAKMELLRYKVEVVDTRAAVLKAEETLKAVFGASGKPNATTAEAITAVVKTHPDVKVAEAKRAVADAELEQAKLLVSQKVTVAFAKFQQAGAKVTTTDAALQRMAVLLRQGSAPQAQGDAAEARAKEAKAELAAAEAELKAATGGGDHPNTDASVDMGLKYLGAAQYLKLKHTGQVEAKALAGSPTDKLRDLIDKKVKLDLKGIDLPAALADVFKAAGADGQTVRGLSRFAAGVLKDPPRVQDFSGEQTFTAWVQMLIDDFNRDARQRSLPPEFAGQYDLYVREYGLSFTRVDLAPKDALTLAEFAKAVRAEKAAEKEKEKKAEPKK